MRILFVDEDTRDVPQITDELRQLGHDVQHATTVEEAKAKIREFLPEGIVLDLMMPPGDLPLSECGGGYTTGAFLYASVLHELAIGIPLIVFSSAFLETVVVRHGLDSLKQFSEFRGVLSKGCDVEDIVNVLAKAQSRP